MSSWKVIPCLLALRDEFNALNPQRDKGADGTIGDSSHTSSSDHTPDEDSSKLENKDSDHANEVHALDIDSTGAWPVGRTFKQIFLDVIELEREKWNAPADKCRLNYAIFDRKIYDKDNDFQPANYTGSDPHTNHAHFSARYETSCENDTRPWGVTEDDVTKDELKAWMTEWAKSTEGKNALLAAGGKADVVKRYVDGEPLDDPANPFIGVDTSLGSLNSGQQKLKIEVDERFEQVDHQLFDIQQKIDQLMTGLLPSE